MKAGNIRTAAYVIVFLFVVVAIKLWQLQVMQGGKLRALSEENRLRIVKSLAPRGIIFDRNGNPLVKNNPYFCVSLLPGSKDRAELGKIASFLGITENEINEKLRRSRSIFESVKLKEGLSLREVAYIEARLSDYPALTIDVDVSRKYLYGDLAAHLIGYIGKLTPYQTVMPDFKDVPRDAFVGQWGVEKLYDRELRGTPGEEIIEVNALGRELRVLMKKPPDKGEDLTLSIDLDIQRKAEEAFGAMTGALVAIRPKTGEILSLVSRPSFDPNLFSKGIRPEIWKGLAENKKYPMLNRALQSQYPPGSTFKIVTALAALETNSITPDTKVACSGQLSLGRWSFGCWRHEGHGTMSLHRAMVESCDVYFYTAGMKTGIDRMAQYARALGLDKGSGLALVKEKTGLIPDTDWKMKAKRQKWFLGETYNTAIGQGYVSVTPFQMARMMATVANGGHLVAPTLMKTEQSQAAEKIGIREETLKTMRDALRGVVNEPGGTGWAAKTPVADVGGKTGTAQTVSLRKGKGKLGDHAWFVAFAPVEDPDIAVSVMVEHGGHGGAAAAPIARRAIEAYLGKKTGKPGAQRKSETQAVYTAGVPVVNGTSKPPEVHPAGEVEMEDTAGQ